jgi:hypothetical protein
MYITFPGSQASLVTDSGSGPLADWFARKNLDLVSKPGRRAHDTGSTLDLVLNNLPIVYTYIAEHLHTGSDHCSIVTTIADAWSSPSSVRENILGDAPDDLANYASQVVAGLPAIPIIMKPSEDLDLFGRCSRDGSSQICSCRPSHDMTSMGPLQKLSTKQRSPQDHSSPCIVETRSVWQTSTQA